jgi:uncharacterized protein YjbI with pentapeptide repeats
MAEKLDPFDVEALGNAVNDSAGRVSTIWVSFLIFALYLLTAATTVTNRQLFLAEPVKLPVLNIDLPLWGFFFLAPILFVIFHIYVLLQVTLLARTAAVYNDAVERAAQRDNLTPADDASLRQRLANTLFAQIFAGSPRERGGWFGWLLKAMAWITLVAAPILILVVFQFAFLPYHSHIATWTHRLLIGAELIVAFALWPLVLNSDREFVWKGIWTQIKRATILPLRLLGPKDARREEWAWLKQQRVRLTCCALYVLVCWSVASFPGEPHVNLFTGQRLSSVQCDRWLQQEFSFADLRFDRIVVPHIDAIDHQKLEQIEKETEASGEAPYQGERTRSVRDRDLNCGNFSDFADLRRIDWTGAQLRSADFLFAKLQGATLEKAELQGAFLLYAQLQGASLVFAQLQGASLDSAQLQGARLDSAEFQGASLVFAQLQGASLFRTQLQGARLDRAELQGASLALARLRGAVLDNAQLQGASLEFTQLQGAVVRRAQLQGANFNVAQLQGADFADARFDHTILSKAWTWRAKHAACSLARVVTALPQAVIELVLPSELVPREPDKEFDQIPATPDTTAEFIEASVAKIPDGPAKEAAAARMRVGLVVDLAHDDTAAIAKTWNDCQNSPTSTMPQEQFDQEHAELLRSLVCNAEDNRTAIAAGIVGHWINSSSGAQLARSLLGEDGRQCAATKDFDEATIKALRQAGARAAPAPNPPK